LATILGTIFFKSKKQQYCEQFGFIEIIVFYKILKGQGGYIILL
jgi:hypothetical protein